jgi:hypothetical protein
MSIALVEAWCEKQRIKGIVKFLLRRVAHPCVLVVLAYIFPKLAIFYAICGLYDVSRNRVNVTTLRRYFLGNGFATWALSPINVFLDLISLPHINRGVYRLGDLPTAQQEEVTRLIQAAKDVDLVRQLDERAKENERTMIFFRWYGVNVDTFLDVPAFHQPWKYIETIGVSIFNRRVSTSKHFGFMRATLRVLYNLNEMTDDTAYIVGPFVRFWGAADRHARVASTASVVNDPGCVKTRRFI